MVGDSRQDNRDSSFNQRNYSSRRGRGNMNRGDVRGNRQKSDFRGRNSRGNFENKRDYGSYPLFRSQQQSEEPSQPARFTKFDGNKLSDPNEFPALNDMSSQTKNSRNSKKLEDSSIASQNVSNETKKFSWRGQGQNMFRKNHEGTYIDNRNQHISKHTNDGAATPNYERNYENSNKINRSNYQYANRGGRNNRRVSDGPRRNSRGANIQPANFFVNPQQYDAIQPAECSYYWFELPGLFSGMRIVSPPSMEGHEEFMPGDSKQDYEECHYYKTRVNDDTLDTKIRIQSQLEFYFSDFNLRTDIYLRDMMDLEGYVYVDKILEFNRMIKLKTTKELLKSVVEGSNKLEYDETKERIRRVNGPQHWTTIGLLIQIILVYMSYMDHPNFNRWYNDAHLWIHNTIYPQQTAEPYQLSNILVAYPWKYDNFIQQCYSLYLYYDVGNNGYSLIGEVWNVAVPKVLIQLFQDPMKTELLGNEAEQYNEVEANEFISVMKGLNAQVENNVKPNIEIEDQLNEISSLTNELSIDDEPVNLRNPKSFHKVKPQPHKFDRHSANSPKNIKQENRRDVVQQVQDGILSYNHEFTKKSNSTHGSLSTHPEAASKVFVSSASSYKKDTKENKEKNITVVEGSNIIRDKNIINEAIEKVKQGEEEPIIISTNRKHNQVNQRRGQKDGKKPATTSKSRQDPLGTDGQSRSK